MVMNARRSCLFLACALAAGVAFAGRLPVVNEAVLPTMWSPAPGVPHYVPGYPDKVADKSADVCITIGYSVGADGGTSGFSELNSWTSAHPDGLFVGEESDPYTQIAAAVVSRRKFVPVGKAHAVFTSATFAFDGSNPLDEQAILAHCRIADLEDFVVQLQAQSRKRGDLDTEALRRRLEIEQGRR